MTGNFGFAINLEFVSDDNSKLLENIYQELDEKTYESIILRKTLLTPELENGQIIFSGINLEDYNHQCDEELVNKVMEISEKYNGKFVGKFYWKYYEDNLEKHYTFSKNGKISSEFPN
jgi:hypothetical protein